MHPEIEVRFQRLEDVRRQLIERVRALPSDKQNHRPGGNSMSPVQVVLHMALAEELSLARMAKRPPSSLKGVAPKPSFIFRRVISTMAAAKRSPGPPSTMPKEPVELAAAEKKWDEVRERLRAHFEEVEGPTSAIQRGFPFGVLAASDLLTLFESHSHYHTTLFPQV